MVDGVGGIDAMLSETVGFQLFPVGVGARKPTDLFSPSVSDFNVVLHVKVGEW